MEMFFFSFRASLLYISAELDAQFSQLCHELLCIAVVGNIAELTVLVIRLRVVNFVISFVGELVGTAVSLSIKSTHHTDAAYTVLGVHVISLIAERGEIHTGRIAFAIDKTQNWLAK